MNNNDFISECEATMSGLADNISNTIKGSLERLKQINAQLDVSKYRLVFIGAPGSGKTTTICNFLNLKIDAATGDQFERLELFETAPGRTTAAEVRFQKASCTALIVYPMDISQQQAIIKIYCSYIWNLAFPDENTDEEQLEQESSIEIETIICNMLGCESEEELLDYVIQQYSDDELSLFINNTLERLSINSQSPVEYSFDGSEDVKKWLQSTFSGINKGRAQNTCIPKRVDVLLNPDDLDFYMPDYISEIIDTRGYDGNEREDLREYFLADDTICVILDGVKALPGSIQSKMLSEWVDKGQSDLINRLSLLINVEGHELAGVSGADGDPDKGEKKKLFELRRATISKKLNYRLENTLFIDPYKGLKIEEQQEKGGKRIVKGLIECDETSITEQRQRITAHYEGIISHHRDTLVAEAEQLKKDISQVLNFLTTSSQSRVFSEKLNYISTKITTISEMMQEELLKAFHRHDKAFCTYFRSRFHWRSAQCMAYSYGDGRSVNIYSEYAAFCERLIRQHCFDKKQKIINSIQLLNECEVSSEENIKSLINSCITTVNLRYYEMTDSSRRAAKSLCEEALSEKSWYEVQNVPRGKGYYDRLMEAIWTEMVFARLNDSTSAMIQSKANYFVDEIIRALENKPENL